MFAILDNLLPLFSLGLGVANTQQTDPSQLVTRVPSYEMFAQSYFSTSFPDVFLRPGLRLAFEPSTNIEQPRGIHITEKSYRSALELGVLYNGYLVPSLLLSGTLVARRLQLESDSSVIVRNSNDLTRTEWLAQGGVTLGLGLPVIELAVVIEPFYRFIWLQKDERQRSQWGFDVSYALSIL